MSIHFNQQQPSIASQQILGDAIRYWETRRIAYNLVLTAAVLAWIVLTWPHFRPALNLHVLPVVFVLAALANFCYCAAYLADIPIQYSPVRSLWRRRRWGLLLIGTLLALLIANYWIADEIYPFVR
ncbi:MAG: hypothetical protein WB559_06025 [Candidatus Acidiferrales bacterium]